MITYYPTGKLITVDYDHVKSFLSKPEDYNPIPLKASLLTVAGFDETETNKWDIPLLPFQLVADQAGDLQYELSDNKPRHVSSLHQLQNLYLL